MSETSTTQPVTIITVCYNSMAVLPAMLATVPDGVALVLVDNASDDGTELADCASRQGARLIRNDVNRGFGVACNQGAGIATTEFLLFLNPDATLAPDALDELIAAAARYPEASAMNPRIAEAGGRPYFKRSSHLMARSEKAPRGWPREDCEIPVLSGAALFVRRADFEKVGGFDPAIFLYHEDDDLGRRLREVCGPLMFIRAALVQHLGGRSSARNPEIAALKAWHMGRSRVYAARKHGRPFAFGSAALQSVLQLASPFNLLSKRKRAKSWNFFKGVFSEGISRELETGRAR
ncbi:MAG: glycosyltransferase family 2 protein [Rhodobacteraceae bacterium]|nr:glycosyltransferase family 2 protein [Paracoccaceae bacterium]MCP5341349.1 glycosyltransferase family 2 protein [Paracoccaceae bacterium]